MLCIRLKKAEQDTINIPYTVMEGLKNNYK